MEEQKLCKERKENEETHDEEAAMEPDDEDFLGTDSFCTTCCMIKCLCAIMMADKRLQMLKLRREIMELEAKDGIRGQANDRTRTSQ